MRSSVPVLLAALVVSATLVASVPVSGATDDATAVASTLDPHSECPQVEGYDIHEENVSDYPEYEHNDHNGDGQICVIGDGDGAMDNELVQDDEGESEEEDNEQEGDGEESNGEEGDGEESNGEEGDGNEDDDGEDGEEPPGVQPPGADDASVTTITICYPGGEGFSPEQVVEITTGRIAAEIRAEWGVADRSAIRDAVRETIGEMLDEPVNGMSLPVRVGNRLYVVNWIVCYDEDGVPDEDEVGGGDGGARGGTLVGSDGDANREERAGLHHHENGHAYVSAYLWELFHCLNARTGVAIDWVELLKDAQQNYHRMMDSSDDDDAEPEPENNPDSDWEARQMARQAVERAINESGFKDNANAEPCFPDWYGAVHLRNVTPGDGEAYGALDEETTTRRLATLVETEVGASDLSRRARHVVGDERIQVHVGDHAFGVVTDPRGVPQRVAVGGIDDPTLIAEMDGSTARAILDAEDPVDRIHEGVESGEITYHGVGPTGSVKVTGLKIAAGAQDLLTGLSNGVGDLVRGVGSTVRSVGRAVGIGV